jgi:predicted ATP-grasp superfamily ATP-dependent carboligase
LFEVNPRYTASLEVLEYAYRMPLLRWHAEALAGWPSDGFTLPDAVGVVGKAIYYAPRRIVFPETGPWGESLAHCTDVWLRPNFADIPGPGTTIEHGHPVLTILAAAETEADCLARLKSRAAELDLLFGHTAAAEAGP